MDEREALERLAAADHAEYVAERARAAVAGCEEKVEKLKELIDGTQAAGAEAADALEAAEAALEAAVAAADEVPMDLRAWVMTHRPDITAAHVGPAVASGGAS